MNEDTPSGESLGWGCSSSGTHTVGGRRFDEPQSTYSPRHVSLEPGRRRVGLRGPFVRVSQADVVATGPVAMVRDVQGNSAFYD